MLEHLRSPISIGNMTLRNRMVMAPMGVEIVGDDGRANEGIIRYYEERARGGVGLIITEVCAMAYPRGATSVHQLGLADDSFIAPLAELTERVHAQGAKIAIQLVHHGKISRVDMKQGRDVLVPSMPEWHGSFDMASDLTADELGLMAAASDDGMGAPRFRPMTTDDIAQLVDEFAEATLRGRDAGFDGVEIHGAHGYLISGFLSKQWNRRDDDYGGSIENRSRLLCEVLTAAKARAGADFPVWCRLDALEYRTPDGIVFEDTEITARLAVEAGADAIHLSAYGDMTSGPAFTEGTLPHVEAKHAALTARLKKQVSVPVIGVGRISPAVGDEMIAHGKADLIAMGRQMLADPETALKVEEERLEDIRPCINCYTCVAQPFFDRRVRCVVNPALAEEAALADADRSAAPHRRNVVVVGGGPAGMEAARVAAARGHRVTLFEAGPHLGGALRFAALVYEPNRRLLVWLTRQMADHGVDVRLNTPATPELVRDIRPDALIVATGAARVAPDLPGIDRRLVMDGDDLRAMLTGAGAGVAEHKLSLVGRLSLRVGRRFGFTEDPARLARLTHLYMPVGHRVVVIGGGLVGIELAEFLVERGRTVTVLEEGDTMAPEMAHPRRWRVLTDLRDHGAALVVGAEVREILADGVRYASAEGETVVAADSVIVATGLMADEAVADRFRAAGFADLVAIGDCTGVGYLEGAIHEGFHAGLEVG